MQGKKKQKNLSGASIITQTKPENQESKWKKRKLRRYYFTVSRKIIKEALLLEP
jgi:hypothetical protein